MYGTRLLHGRASTQTATVPNATTAVGQSISATSRTSRTSVSQTDMPRGQSKPNRLRTCEFTIRIAAPAVNPTITLCGTRSTARPRPARPMASCQNPTMKVSVITSCTYAGDPGAASGPISPSTVNEIAFAGPVTISRLAPNSAAIRHGTIALYSPYCGGMPASVANATPCGSTTIAPVSPAIRSARTVARSRNNGSHARKGSRRPRLRRSAVM